MILRQVIVHASVPTPRSLRLEVGIADVEITSAVKIEETWGTKGRAVARTKFERPVRNEPRSRDSAGRGATESVEVVVAQAGGKKHVVRRRKFILGKER